MHHLTGEGLVDFPQIDVRDRQPEALEQFGDGVDRPDAHFFRGTAAHGHPAVHAQRFNPALPGFGAAH